MAIDKKDDIIIGSGELHLDIILPKADPESATELMEKELNIKCGRKFLPLSPRADNFFGRYGQRWHVNIVVDPAQAQDFYKRLQLFCENHGFDFVDDTKK